MKALIVDDEKHVRQAIRMLANWEEAGITQVMEAENGEEAICVIEHQRPQIILTDMMMPVKNGLELLTWIHAQALNSKTIVISGYKDYEFMRHTVKSGGTDYLLKPIDPAQLQDAIMKAAAAWKKEHRESLRSLDRNMELKLLKPLFLNQALTNLIDQPQSLSDNKRMLREIPQLNTIDACCAAVLSLDILPQSLLDKFGYQRDLLEFSLLNICNEWLSSDKNGIAFKHQYKDNEIVILLWDDEANHELIAHRMLQSIRDTYQASLVIAIGRKLPFPQDLGKSYAEAVHMLLHRNLRVQNDVLMVEHDSSATAANLHFMNWEEKVRVAVKYGGTDQIHAVIEDWLQAVMQSEIVTVSHLQQWNREIGIVLDRLAAELHSLNGRRMLLADTSLQNQIQLHDGGFQFSRQWKQQLVQQLTDMNQQFFEARNRNENIMQDIAHYIQSHYHREITLQEISDKFFLSREYISRRFKQEFGENIVEFLSRIRIESAKPLLTNPKLKIAEISQAVGYQDEKYFSRVFKKLVGVSPLEYRIQRSKE